MRLLSTGFLLITLTAGAVGGTIACASSSGGLGAAVARAQQGTDSTQVTVKVENHSFWDVVIYAIPQNGIQTRLGTVTGNLTATLTVPSNLLVSGQAIRFVAQPIGGGRSARTDQVYLQPGDEVTLTVPPS